MERVRKGCTARESGTRCAMEWTRLEGGSDWAKDWPGTPRTRAILFRHTQLAGELATFMIRGQLRGLEGETLGFAECSLTHSTGRESMFHVERQSNLPVCSRNSARSTNRSGILCGESPTYPARS